MKKNRVISQERLVTIATIIVLVATAGVATWLAYFVLIRPSVAIPQLPSNVIDLRMKPAPELPELIDPLGDRVSVDLAQERVVVAFLLTTCPACNRAKPVLDELWLEGKAGVVGIFAESDQAVNGYTTQFPRYNDPSRESFEAFGALTLPAIYVLKNGVVVAQTSGWAPNIERSVRASVNGGE